MRNESPTSRAFWKLTELARLEGLGDAKLFALTWLAAGRMVTAERVPTVATIDQLADLETWKALFEAGLPYEALDHISMHRAAVTAHEVGLRAAAAGIVADLYRELGRSLWDVLPSMVENTGRRDFDGVGTLVPELVSLLLDLVGEPDDSELWIPFDSSGQLTIEALRRGWNVLAASPMSVWPVILQLLMTIEVGHPLNPRVRRDVDRDANGRPVGRANFALVMPPFGVQVKDSRMATWDANGDRGFEQYARSETWAIHEFVNRINKRGVFVAPQGVLFAKGQEQRLREYLLHRGGECNEVETVIALPPGVFSSVAMAGAVLVLSPGIGTDAVRMVDLGSGRRSLQDAGELVKAGREIALGHESTGKARLVSPDEIAENEYSFAPSRYLRRVAELGTTAMKLGDICMALRPPTTVKEPGSYGVAEVGMQDLNDWRPINQSIEKTVFLKGNPRDSVLLQPGDIVLSIKGTVGKSALMGEAAQERPTVVSQSCLALRPSRELVIPQYLLMYLRSPHGQAQLEGLQVGAGVQHISPSTLLGSLQVPVPPLETQGVACADFERLCQLEDQVAQMQGEINDLTQHRWPAEVQ